MSIVARTGDLTAEASAGVWAVSILVDSSRDGGAWWFPQSGSFDPLGDHQGKALADYMRSLGFHVRELPRPTEITAALLDGYHMVIRANVCGSYTGSEVRAYTRFIEGGRGLLLLADHKRNCAVDDLAQSLGIAFLGVTRGNQRMRFVADPVTQGMDDSALKYGVGSGLLQVPNGSKMLAHLDADSYLDLNFNGSREANEPRAPMVMGQMAPGHGLIIFAGDTNFMEWIPQPLTDNILRVLLPGSMQVSQWASGPAVFLAQRLCIAGC